jgi:hypothetical protein
MLLFQIRLMCWRFVAAACLPLCAHCRVLLTAVLCALLSIVRAGGSRPGTPSVTAVAGDGWVHLTMTAAANGQPITHFWVRYGPTLGSTRKVTGTSFNFTGLTNGTHQLFVPPLLSRFWMCALLPRSLTTSCRVPVPVLGERDK